jgi:hypothetical protein
MQCRYAGHCLRFYSVAEHSWLMSFTVSPENALCALLHDATEAYLVDVPRPIKGLLGNYREHEDKLYISIAKRFGLPETIPDEVHDHDKRMLKTEMRLNMAMPPEDWTVEIDELPDVHLYNFAPTEAKGYFLSRFRQLNK